MDSSGIAVQPRSQTAEGEALTPEKHEAGGKAQHGGQAVDFTDDFADAVNKRKGEQEHEDRMRIATEAKEAKKRKITQEEELKKQENERKAIERKLKHEEIKQENERKAIEKKLKHEEILRQQAEARARREELAAHNRREQEELAKKARMEREAKKAENIAANLRQVEQAKMDRRDKELKECVLKVSTECLIESMKDIFSHYGMVDSIKMDKFGDSYVVRFADVEAKQRALAAEKVEGSLRVSMNVGRQLVKAHCCFMPTLISNENKANFGEYSEKLKAVVETVGPVEHVDTVKGHPVIMFKDMETAEMAATRGQELQMDGKILNLILGLPKRM